MEQSGSLIGGDLDVLLSSFYGINEPDALTIFEPVYDLNSVGFDRMLHSQRAIQHKNLHDLVQFENELFDDIKSIDSELQMIIYENYGKFIAATDTIHNMKTTVELMESQLCELTEHTNALQHFHEELHGNLETNQARLHRLVGIRNQLNRLHFILQLPCLLETYLNAGRFMELVHAYLDVAPVLATYIHITSFARLGSDVDLLMTRTRQQLRLAVRDDCRPSTNHESLTLACEETVGHTNISRKTDKLGSLATDSLNNPRTAMLFPFALAACDAAELLLQLEEPMDSCWSDLMDSRRRYFLKKIQINLSRKENPNSASTHAPVLRSTDVSERWSGKAWEWLVGELLLELTDFIQRFQLMFYQHKLIITVGTTTTTTLAELNGALISMLREVFSSALTLARTAMMDEIVSSSLEPPSSNRHSKDHTLKFCQQLHALQQAVSPLHSLGPAAGLADKTADFIEHCIRYYIEHCAHECQQDSILVLRQLHRHFCACTFPPESSGFGGAEVVSEVSCVVLAAGFSSVAERMENDEVESVLDGMESPFTDLSVAELATHSCALLVRSRQHLLDVLSPLAGHRSPGGLAYSYCSVVDRLDLCGLVSERVAVDLQNWMANLVALLRGSLLPEPGSCGGRVYRIRIDSSMGGVAERWLRRMMDDRAQIPMCYFAVLAQIARSLASVFLAPLVKQLHYFFPLIISQGLGVTELAETQRGMGDTTTLLLMHCIESSAGILVAALEEANQALNDTSLTHESDAAHVVIRSSTLAEDDNASRGLVPKVHSETAITPDACRPIILLILKELKRFEIELSSVIATASCDTIVPVSTAIFSSRPRQSSGAAQSSLGFGFDRLFAKRLVIAASPRYDTTSVLFTLLKILLKAFSESLRLCVLNDSGHLQVQVDLRYLSDRIPCRLAAEQRADLEHLYAEIATTARERCISVQICGYP